MSILSEINEKKALAFLQGAGVNLNLSFGLEAFDEFLHDLLAAFFQRLICELLLFLIEALHIGALAIFEGEDIGVIFLGVNLIRERFLCRQCYSARPHFRKLSDFGKLSSAAEKPPGFFQF